MPYSPLGRGFLTGAIRRPEDLAEDDFRRGNPRFQNFTRNPALVEKVGSWRRRRVSNLRSWRWPGIGAGETHRADPRHQAPSLPEENVAAAEITLSAAELAAIEAVFPLRAAAGDRYGAESMTYING